MILNIISLIINGIMFMLNLTFLIIAITNKKDFDNKVIIVFGILLISITLSVATSIVNLIN